MELSQFIEKFADQFDVTAKDEFTPSTDFKSLPEWDSLIALSVISMVDDEMEKRITGADVRSCKTVEELFNLAQAK